MNHPIFLPPQFGPWAQGGAMLPQSGQIYARAFAGAQSAEEWLENIERFQRGEFGADQFADLQASLALTLDGLKRSITSATSALPIRENLEAPARLIIPLDTPLRNRLPRVPGAGLAAAWRQLTSVGGGYGVSTTVTSGTSSTTQTVGSTAGMKAGDSLYFATTNAYRIVASVTNATTVVLTATISTTTGEAVSKGPYNQPGSGSAVRAFFAESGAPAAHTEAYAAKSSSYKLLGTYFDITGLAMAAGANFQNQYETVKLNAIRTLMLNEENALINADSSSTAAPWGDGSNALAFDGLLALIATGNGTPAEQVQSSVGALTFAHIDQQLTRQWNQGAQDVYIVVNAQEALSIGHLASASGSIHRVVIAQEAGAVNLQVTHFVHQMYGKVPIMTSRFMPAGTIAFCAGSLPDGSNALEVDVLPQVQLPELAPTDMIQGYTAQELAPTTTAPQVYPGIVTVYETLKMKAATMFAKSTGVTAV